MAHDVVLIPGDGIGPEITQAMRRVVEAAGVQINWNVQEAGAGVMDEFGTPLPQHVLDAVAETKVAIKGPITTPVGTGFRSVNVALRKHFDLYACVRPCLSQPGDGSRFRDVDLVIVRENTEDLYAGIEFDEGAAEVEELSQLVERSGQKTFAADSAISIKPISIAKSRRIVEYAFEYARRCGRKKVTAVHKANIMKATDGLFLRVAREVAAGYPDIEFNDKIVDATCMGLVQDPYAFDVLVLPNLYGDIVSDLAAGLVGGLGMAPGANIGRDIAIFEATHGSAPDIEFNDKIVDATCMGLVQNPNDFDVLVLPNLYGDIVSDLCAGLVGGLGMAPGSNIGADCAIFEATHGSAPDIAGQDIANPTAEILSAAMMLDHLGENDAANRIRAAVSATLDEGEQVTGDVRRAQTGPVEGAVGTQAFADAVIAHLA